MLGWTERDLARRAAVPYQRVQALERASPAGKAPYSRYLARILEALDEGDDHPTPAAPKLPFAAPQAAGDALTSSRGAQRMNVSIGERWEGFVERIIKSGRYGSTSEVVREGLPLVEERETKLAALREKIDTSIAPGEEVPDDELDADLAAKAMELRARGYGR